MPARLYSSVGVLHSPGGSAMDLYLVAGIVGLLAGGFIIALGINIFLGGGER